MFHLIQRLEKAPNEPADNTSADRSGATVATTLNAGFSLDYMAATEFEVGPIPESANRMTQAAAQLHIATDTLVTVNLIEPVYFIGTSESTERLLPKWHTWIQNPQPPRPLAYLDRDWAKDEEYYKVWGKFHSSMKTVGASNDTPFQDLLSTHEELDLMYKHVPFYDQNGKERLAGWWALSEDLIWTRHEETAENILAAFQRLRQSKPHEHEYFPRQPDIV